MSTCVTKVLETKHVKSLEACEHHLQTGQSFDHIANKHDSTPSTRSELTNRDHK